jgi:Tfp pilus assembly protein PilF
MYTFVTALTPFLHTHTHTHTHTYRAAAYIKIQELQKALDDCKKAISLNPGYARAHGRMGYKH